MITGSYLLSVSCAADCERQRIRDADQGAGEALGQFIASGAKAARARAKARGWIFAKGDAWCTPGCMKRGAP